jgi:hypothetical protein
MSLTTNRISGVAPLAVFFDATGTTSPLTTMPFHDIKYTWGFGDPAGNATWAYGSRVGQSSKNIAYGAVAGHVFETPGTYTVTVTAFDGTNTNATTTTITVTDPNVVFSGANTVCFSTSADYANCPAGAAHVQTSNFATAVNTNMAPNRRLLFRRGETFSSAAAAIITANGPGMIGAFGSSTDPKPVVLRQSSQYDVMLTLGTASTALIGDWRIMDLDLNGQNIEEAYNIGIDTGGEFNNLLALRLTVRGTWRGVAASHWALAPGKSIYDGWSIVDSTMTGIPGCTYVGKYDCDWRVYIAGKHHSVQGNSLDNEDTGGSHVIRSEYLAKSVISNNYIARAGIIQHAIKLHAWAWGGGAGGNSTASTYSEQVIISDNKIVGGINPWTVAIEPQNDQMDERIRDVVFERNWLTTGTGTQIGVNSSAATSTFRNNIVNIGSVSANHSGMVISRRGVEATPDNVAVYNNTFYSGSTGDFVGIQVGTATNVTIKNNLGSASSSTNPVMVSGTGTGGLVQSNNSSAFQIKNTSPGFVTPPISTVDWKPVSGYAIDGGTAVPVWDDFFMMPRTGTYDMGAVLP